MKDELKRKHGHYFLDHSVGPGLDDFHRPFVFIANVVVQVQPVQVTDVMAVVILAFFFLGKGLIAQRAVVAGDCQVAEGVNSSLLRRFAQIASPIYPCCSISSM